MQLLVGHTLYNDSSVVVRELVQNGIDATRLQIECEKKMCIRDRGVIAMLQLDVRNQIFGVPESSPAQIDEEASAAVTGEEQENEAEEEKEIVYPYNEMDIDFDALKASASGSGSAWLSEYFASLIPTRQNEYPGMFEGYNVIFILSLIHISMTQSWERRDFQRQSGKR